jgi:AcrR family transcriptional regulator
MDDLSHLMLEPDSASRHAMVTDLGITLVGERGWAALTPASLGQALGLTRQAVHQWFGDQQALRLVFARQFTGRWTRWLDVRVYAHSHRGLLPGSEQTRRWARVWLALVEQSVRDDDLGAIVTHARQEEAALLRRHLAARAAQLHDVRVTPLPVLVDALHGAVDGLRVRACRADDASAAGEQLDLAVASHLRTLVEGSCLTSSNGG